jgi:hypothetical protein
MLNLTFKNMEELSDYFQSEEGLLQNSKAILKIISEAYSENKKVANLFAIDLEDEETEMTVKITRPEWVKALRSCLAVFEKNEEPDESIDAYLLIQKLSEEGNN